ncbi:MarR family transcriptional regulator [Streptomyces tateyamensis]|uniref:MarR family transcriptional regulator n=1 Tax=Streptomyces tateyamensis TaxID=565073 RepID=A0A2V4NY98_9ACTN|nr:transcriptional regulator [Streptomyces tateyamensis]PYC76825.1 MarR family transcriptional regulator [Streptomyces tateyamensis]
MSATGRPAGGAPDALLGLEQLLLDPTRLTIVSLVSATTWCEFAFVRDQARLSDSALSKQLTTLDNAEFVEIRKGHVGKRPRTWVRATAAGRERLRAHLAALQQIADRAQQAAADHPEAEANPTG